MKILPKFLVGTLGLMTIVGSLFPSSALAQTIYSRTLTLSTEGQSDAVMKVSNTDPELVNDAAAFGATALSAGVGAEAVNTGIEFIFAGADPQSVTDTMVAIGGLNFPDEMTTYQLAKAVEGFNGIVDEADGQTLKNLQAIPEFRELRSYLGGLRAEK